MSDPYTLVLMPSAMRSLETKMKPAVAFAMLEFLNGPVCENPKRLGKPLAEPFLGLLSARRGQYRAVYRIDDQAHRVLVVAVEHRADIYRPR